MPEQRRTIEELWRTLGPNEQEAVRSLIESLQSGSARVTPTTASPRFGWAGALSDLRDSFTSVELQHELLNTRIEKQ